MADPKPLSNNLAYFAEDAVDKTTDCISFKLDHEGETFDITCGFGTEYKSMAGGLKQVMAEVTRCWRTGSVPSGMVVGTEYLLTFGAEGQTPGTGKHSQNFILKSVSGLERKVEAGLLAMTYSYESTGDPVSNVFAGDTW